MYWHHYVYTHSKLNTSSEVLDVKKSLRAFDRELGITQVLSMANTDMRKYWDILGVQGTVDGAVVGHKLEF